jgi:hypothetical protein
MLPVQIAVWCFLGYLGGKLAARRGYPPRLGIILGIVLGPFALLIAALILPYTAAGRQQLDMEMAMDAEIAESMKPKNCPECGREVTMAARFCPRCNYRF